MRGTYLKGLNELAAPIGLDDMLDHLDYLVKRIRVDHVGISSDGFKGYQDSGEALNVTIALLERGYTDSDIKKIWGGNFLRVWRAAQAGAQAAK